MTPQGQDQSQTWNPSTGVNSGRESQGSEPDLIDSNLKVAQAMTVAPRTCSPMSMVHEAVMIFRDEDCGVVPVTDGEIPVGVLTDRDVALALANHETDLPHV